MASPRRADGERKREPDAVRSWGSFDAWDEPLPEVEREKLLDQTVRAIARRGLQTPAILLLEMHKPLAYVASQGIVAAVPLLGPLLGLERMQAVGKLLATAGGMDELIARIEASAVETDAVQTAQTDS